MLCSQAFLTLHWESMTGLQYLYLDPIASHGDPKDTLPSGVLSYI